MTCLINNVIDFSLQKGKRLEVIKRYIQIKYRVNIDNLSIKKRMTLLKPEIGTHTFIHADR